MFGACGTHAEEDKAYKNLVEKPEGNRPLERPARRWENNIKVDLKEIEWEGVDWLYLAHVVKIL
jgi:hypothetical protein